jgi:hypothetical protein
MAARKDCGLRLRLERELREQFVESCREAGQPAAEVLRDFMREYISRHQAVMQPDLFSTGRSAAAGR